MAVLVVLVTVVVVVAGGMEDPEVVPELVREDAARGNANPRLAQLGGAVAALPDERDAGPAASQHGVKRDQVRLQVEVVEVEPSMLPRG